MNRPERKQNFERLGILYALALLSIAAIVIASQLFVQTHLERQETDSQVINLAGRQRMLSQQVSKLALQIAEAEDDRRQTLAQELQSVVNRWTYTHEALRYGSDSLNIPQENSPAVDAMFRQMEPAYQAMRRAAQLLAVRVAASAPPVVWQTHVDTILTNESRFLTLMDDIVFRYDAEARQRVIRLRRIELVLLGVSLLIILLELFFIFRPTAQQIRTTVSELTQSEQTARSMAREISVLYSSLENSYQELATVQTEEVPAQVYAKTNQEGQFTYVSDSFQEVLEYDPSVTTANLFGWLEQQGYAADHVQVIAQLVQKGELWNGEVKAVTDSGDFVWLDMNILPVLDGAQQTTSFSVVCTDKTERKEAETRSHEMIRDRIEKKLKEQRFRSILILEGQEEERRRISRDMHDGIGQLLTALKFKIEAIDLAPDLPTRESKIDAARQMLNQVIKEVRRVSFNLNPSALTDYGIVPVIKRFCAEASRLSEKNVIFDNQTGFINRMDKSIETHLYRIIQEGVNNAIKYSQAEEIKVIFNHNSQYLNVDVVDNGVGFDYVASRVPHSSANGSGLGLFNMQERASFINGTLTIDAAPNQGTTVNIHLPIQT